MKKKILILVLLLLLLCGCNKKDNNTLNVLNWSSYIPDEVIRAFEKESGIKVNYSTYSSNEELLAKVSSVVVDKHLLGRTVYQGMLHLINTTWGVEIETEHQVGNLKQHVALIGMLIVTYNLIGIR